MNAIVIIGYAAIALGLIGLIALLFHHHSPSHPAAAPADSPTPHITPEEATELEAKLQAAYNEQIKLATAAFAQDLSSTSKRLSEQVERLTTQVITSELEQYQQTLERVRGVAEGTAGQIQKAVEEQQGEMRKTLEATLQAEKTRQLQLLDQRLGDIVSGYIAESLGQGVDLGAQADYIVKALEARREDIKRDLGHGV